MSLVDFVFKYVFYILKFCFENCFYFMWSLVNNIYNNVVNIYILLFGRLCLGLVWMSRMLVLNICKCKYK